MRLSAYPSQPYHRHPCRQKSTTHCVNFATRLGRFVIAVVLFWHLICVSFQRACSDRGDIGALRIEQYGIPLHPLVPYILHRSPWLDAGGSRSLHLSPAVVLHLAAIRCALHLTMHTQSSLVAPLCKALTEQFLMLWSHVSRRPYHNAERNALRCLSAD